MTVINWYFTIFWKTQTVINWWKYSALGLLHGHSGHVRFLTSICASSGSYSFSSEESSIHSGQFKGAVASTSSASPYSAVVISGGDGYEDFGASEETEAAGRDDSTNHLLMWRVWCTSVCSLTELFFFKKTYNV